MAAYDEALYSITLVAGEDLSAHQYRFVQVSAVADEPKGVISAGSAGSYCQGVLQNKPEDTQAATVGISGISRVEAGEAITNGDPVTVDADGKAMVADTAGQHILGTALEDAGATGELIAVLLQYRSVFGVSSA